MKFPRDIVVTLAIVVTIIVGCATLDPGANPLVVRTEQVETASKATFDLVLNIDNSNRPFWRTNAPGFHTFCEWLRQPQVVNVTNTLPRASAMLWSLDTVKVAYISSRASSNDLYGAFVIVENALGQAQAWSLIITNTPTMN